MLTIRLARVGKKKHPTYRVVVQEKQKATSSNVLEILGHYNPHMNPAALEVKAERVQYWVSKGAQLSDTMNNLFVERKIVAGEKRQFVRPKKKEPPEGEVKTEALQAEATPEKGAIPPQPAP